MGFVKVVQNWALDSYHPMSRAPSACPLAPGLVCIRKRGQVKNGSCPGAVSCYYHIHPLAQVYLVLGLMILEILKSPIIAALLDKAALLPAPLLHLAIRTKSKRYCI
jgi:hypothetical protein